MAKYIRRASMGCCALIIGCIGPVPTPTDRESRAKDPSHNWSCEFPKEAEQTKVDDVRVRLEIEIGPNGRAISATAVDDPGNGFARAARDCAMIQHYVVSLDD